MEVVYETNLPNLKYRGKVRDTYEFGDELLIVATDRISAFDVVLPNPIPDKGRVLTQLSAFWFDKTAHLVPNHMIRVVDDPRLLLDYFTEPLCYNVLGPGDRQQFMHYLVGRTMVVKKARRIEVECVARGYLSGSAWAEYKERGTIQGLAMPRGIKESQRLPEPIFTPTTKAAAGHDQPLTLEELEGAVGKKLARELAEKTLAVYQFAHDYADSKGIIIADTKMEFGYIEGQVCLIDELLTPDSSRFWDKASFEVGRSQASFDKQPVRDWLVASGWNKEPPAPHLPPEVIASTTQRYREAYRRLTGRTL